MRKSATYLLGAWLLMLSSPALRNASAKEPEFVMPRAFHAKTYPAHDAHEDEKFTIAADPYDMPDKAALFRVDYKKEGFVPIFFVFSNDGDQPVSLQKMRVVFISKKRVKVLPATTDDIYRRISHQVRRGDEPGVELPIPLPKKKARAVSKEAQAEVEGSQFLARAVEAHSSQAGFMFFDVEGIENPLAGARIEVTGLANGKGDELFYFELPMEKYLNYQPLKSDEAAQPK